MKEMCTCILIRGISYVFFCFFSMSDICHHHCVNSKACTLSGSGHVECVCPARYEGIKCDVDKCLRCHGAPCIINGDTGDVSCKLVGCFFYIAILLYVFLGKTTCIRIKRQISNLFENSHFLTVLARKLHVISLKINIHLKQIKCRIDVVPLILFILQNIIVSRIIHFHQW